MWRGWVVRRWYKTVHAKRTAAATFIKSTWKRRRFRRLLLGQWLSLVRQEKARVEEEARLAAERAAALAKARQLGALTFQRVYRGWKGRRRFTFLRRLYDWTYRREQAVRRVRLDLAPRRSIHTCVRGTGHQDAEVVAYLFLRVQRSPPTAPGGHGGASSANGRGNCASAGVVRGGAERKDGWGYAMQRGPASCCARNADGARVASRVQIVWSRCASRVTAAKEDEAPACSRGQAAASAVLGERGGCDDPNILEGRTAGTCLGRLAHAHDRKAAGTSLQLR